MTEQVVLTLVEVLHFAEIILSINLKRNPLIPIQRTDPYLFVDRYWYMAAFFVWTHRICQQVCIHMAHHKLQLKWVSQRMMSDCLGKVTTTRLECLKLLPYVLVIKKRMSSAFFCVSSTVHWHIAYFMFERSKHHNF